MKHKKNFLHSKDGHTFKKHVMIIFVANTCISGAGCSPRPSGCDG